MTIDLDQVNLSVSGRTLTVAEIFVRGGEVLRSSDAWVGAAAGPVQRVGIIGSETTDMIARAIACGLAQERHVPVVYQAPFGAYVQEALDPASGLHAFAPDLVVVCTHWRDFVQPLPAAATAAEVADAVEPLLDRYRAIWDSLEKGGARRIIQHYPEDPPYAYRGWAERSRPASLLNQVETARRGLVEAAGNRVAWLDLQSLAHRLGSDQWFGERDYLTSRLAFSTKCLGAYLQAFRGVWRAASPRLKKVLALDLDNTLWGGVIGDDGVEGLVLGPGSAVGEAYAGWQRYISALRDRGVVLAACSKNDPATAALGFSHPGAVLRLEDFATFECSWGDKAVGLDRIAKALNVHPSSIVFADDNPVECDLVRTGAPEVEVVHLGSEPSSFIAKLEAGRWFDLDQFTVEDFGRAEAYTARWRASEAPAAKGSDISNYLATLQMQGCLFEAGPLDLPRLAQMEQKTNQFNLTTPRRSLGALREAMDDPERLLLAASLKDRFGDHGLVSSLLACRQDGDLIIENWLMSCRVFARSLESFMMLGLIDHARRLGCSRIVGRFRASDRNSVVAGLYGGLGFAHDAAADIWVRSADAPTADLTTEIVSA